MGPDPDARRAEAGQGGGHDHLRAAVPGLRLRLAARRYARGHGLPHRRLPRQAAPGEARGAGGAQPGVPAVAILRADLPRGRPARHLPAPSRRADAGRACRHEDRPVRELLDLRRSRAEPVPGARAAGRGHDARPGARGPRAPGGDPEPLRSASALRRPQPGPERLARGAVAAARQGDGKGGGMAGPPERPPELDADPGHRLLAGRLPPLAEEGGCRRAGRERHPPGDRLPVRGGGRRPARRAPEAEGRALGLVPQVHAC